MNRRGFLGSILAACAAPAIVRADSLMRLVPTETLVLSVRPVLDVESIGSLVRKTVAYDIGWDWDIVRLDVIGAVGEQIVQKTVDMRFHPGKWTDADLKPALHALTNSVNQEGIDLKLWPKNEHQGDTIRIRMPYRPYEEPR